jgi:hypothetical protein
MRAFYRTVGLATGGGVIPPPPSYYLIRDAPYKADRQRGRGEMASQPAARSGCRRRWVHSGCRQRGWRRRRARSRRCALSSQHVLISSHLSLLLCSHCQSPLLSGERRGVAAPETLQPRTRRRRDLRRHARARLTINRSKWECMSSLAGLASNEGDKWCISEQCCSCDPCCIILAFATAPPPHSPAPWALRPGSGSGGGRLWPLAPGPRWRQSPEESCASEPCRLAHPVELADPRQLRGRRLG